MTLFLIGLLGGLVVGGSMGMLVFALMNAASESDNQLLGGKQYDEK